MTAPAPVSPRHDDALTVAVFGFTLSSLIAAFYVAARWGFPTNPVPIAGALSLAAVLLFGPVALHARLQRTAANPQAWHLSLPALVLFALAATTLAGLLAFYTRLPLVWLLIPLGAVLAVHGLLTWLRAAPWYQSFAFLVLPALFSLWLLQPLYGDLHHHPLYIEGLVVADDPVAGHGVPDFLFLPDTAFHTALGQLVLRFGVASTGLHGLPAINYYLASNVLLVAAAHLVHAPAIEGYILLYPVVLVPVLPASLAWAALDLRASWFNSPAQRVPLRTRPVFWAILLLATIGLSGTVPYRFISESYLASLVLLVPTVALIARVAAEFRRDWHASRPPRSLLLALAALALLLALVGAAKTPPMLVALAALAWLVLRLRLFRSPPVAVAAVITTIVALAVWQAVTWPGALGVRFEPFAFLRCCVPGDRAWLYYPLDVVWLAAALVVLAARAGIRTWSALWAALRSDRLVLAELLLVVAAISLTPGLLLSFARDRGPYAYFGEAQHWLAVLVLLAALPSVGKAGFSGRQTTVLTRIIAIAATAFFGYYVGSEAIANARSVLTLTTQIRAAWLPEAGISPPYTVADAFANYDHTPPRSPSEPATSLLSSLAQLGQSSVPPDTLLYIPKTVEAFWSLPQECAGIPFLAPALSGMPMLHGFPVAECQPFYGDLTDYYHYAFYPDVPRVPLGTPPLPDDQLCADALNLGFSRVLILTTDDAGQPHTRTLACGP